MRSLRDLWLMLLSLGLALGCKQEAGSPALKASDVSRSRRTFVQPLAWLGANRLAFRRVDHLSAGDAGQLACDSTGIYTLGLSDTPDRPQPYSDNLSLCQHTGLTDGFALDPINRIIYYSDASGTPGVYAFDLATSNVVALAADCIPTAHQPAFSRENHLLAFAGRCNQSLSSEASTMYLVGIDGSNLHQVGSKSPVSGDEITWSPAGDRIAYVTEAELESPSIMVSDTTGIRPHRVANGLAPAWSPDGKWIAYLVEGNDSNSTHAAIRMVHPDGAGDRLVWRSTSGVALEFVAPILWSFDGESVIVSSGNSLWQIGVSDSSSRALLSIAPQRE